MPTYVELKENPRQLLAVTSLTVPEFDELLIAFQTVFEARYPTHLTRAGQPRLRQAGGGRKSSLLTLADQLLFILIYQKTYPLQTAHGLMFGLSQPQTNELIQTLLPLVDKALHQLGYRPERDPAAFAQNAPPASGPCALLLDGTERRRQRPKDPLQQPDYYSGKKKAHTDKNLVIANAATRQVAYLGQTQAGHLHDKKMADQEAVGYPVGTQLMQDLGFQGYAPSGVFIIQPKKQPRGKFLSTVDRLANRLKAGARVAVEHVIAGVKRCRIVKEVFRNTAANASDLVMQIACGLHNLRTDFRYLRSMPYQLKNYFR